MQRPHGGVRGVRWDLSVNTNPFPPPQVAEAVSECVESGVLRVYPDPGYAGLRSVLSDYYGVPSEAVVPTGGAAEAINLVVAAASPRFVVTVSPTYGEADLEALCSVIGCSVIKYVMVDEGGRLLLDLGGLVSLVRGLGGGVLAYLTSPNNPSGAPLGCGEVVDELSAAGALVVVDTSYRDMSCARPELLCGDAVVVHSLTKWAGLPGLRAGMAVVGDDLLRERVVRLRQPWSVSSLADCVFRRALVDADGVREWMAGVVERVRELRDELVRGVREAGFYPYPSVTNYVLIRHDGIDSEEFFRAMLARGVGVRPAHTFAGLSRYHTRVSVAGGEAVRAFLEAIEGLGSRGT